MTIQRPQGQLPKVMAALTISHNTKVTLHSPIPVLLCFPKYTSGDHLPSQGTRKVNSDTHPALCRLRLLAPSASSLNTSPQ